MKFMIQPGDVLQGSLRSNEQMRFPELRMAVHIQEMEPGLASSCVSAKARVQDNGSMTIMMNHVYFCLFWMVCTCLRGHPVGVCDQR